MEKARLLSLIRGKIKIKVLKAKEQKKRCYSRGIMTEHNVFLITFQFCQSQSEDRWIEVWRHEETE